MTKIGLGITGSFCTFDKIYPQIKLLKEHNYTVIPIVNEKIIEWDTRFGMGKEIKKKLEYFCGNDVVSTIIEAERFGPTEPLDLMAIAPATGNFVASLANGITDSTVTMAAKATLRNGNPIVIGVSTNDGLSANAKNISELLNRKNVFFVPFGQDDPINKPNSLIAHYDLLLDTINEALDRQQLQPVLREYQKILKK